MKKRITSLILAAVMVFALIPAMAFSATAEDAAATTLDYSDLYVKDGLVMLLTAYDAADESIDYEGNKWSSKVGETYANMVETAAVPWQAGENGKGIAYSMATNAIWRDNSVKLVVPKEFIPTGNYTVETVAKIDYVREVHSKGTDPKAVNGVYTAIDSNPGCPNTYGAYKSQNMTFRFGGFQGMPFLYSLTSNGQAKTIMMGYGATAYADKYGTWRIGDYNLFGSQVSISVKETGTEVRKATVNGTEVDVTYTQYDWKNPTVISVPLTMTFISEVTPAAEAGGTYDREINRLLSNGKQLMSHDNYTKSNEVRNVYVAHDNWDAILFGELPSTVYAVRMYNRVLSETEQNWNHFVDLLAYTGAAVPAGFANVSEAARNVLAAKYATVALTDGVKDTLEQELATAVELAEKAAYSWTDADKLYVIDGLTALYTAYGTDGTLDMSAKTWLNLVDGTTLSVKGDLWSKESQGLTLAMNKEQWSANGGNNYLDLGAAPATDDWTAEMVTIFRGLTNADGTQFIDETANWGIYSSSYSTMEIGMLKACSFVGASPIKAGSGQYATRFSFTMMATGVLTTATSG